MVMYHLLGQVGYLAVAWPVRIDEYRANNTN